MKCRYLTGFAALALVAGGCQTMEKVTARTDDSTISDDPFAPYASMGAAGFGETHAAGTTTANRDTFGNSNAVYGRDVDNRSDARDTDRDDRSTMRDDRATAIDRPAATVTLSSTDQTFIKEAASGGMFEVQASQLALQKNVDQAHKEFAQMMVDDHTAANNELKTIASRKNYTVPKTLQPKHQQLLDSLKNLSGAEFARRYHEIQVQAHQETIALFEKAARECKDADLKAFAQRTLPTLREHLDHVQKHRADVMGRDSAIETDRDHDMIEDKGIDRESGHEPYPTNPR